MRKRSVLGPLYESPSIYQDRLGKNIGKVDGQGCFFNMQVAFSLRARRRAALSAKLTTTVALVSGW
eukprot:COSAG06_NODE_813_length_12161_cov_3.785193_11_plen_66_part_00